MLKKTTFFLALLATFPCAAQTAASKPLNPVIIIVDMQKILDESIAAKDVQKKIEVQSAKFQKEIEGEENGLRAAEQDLGKSRDQIAADAYADREQQLRQRFLTVERHVQARHKALDQAFKDSMNTVRSALMDIVTQAAQEHNANIVLAKQQTVWFDKALDVTDEVLTRLNKQLPQVAVKMPEEKP